jgi:endonuclease YncB( thermonuclease family)
MTHFAAFALSVLFFAIALPAPAQAPQPQYVYRAELSSVVSGDTVALNIDLGFGVWVHNQTLRLQGLTAPDLLGDRKEEALQWKRRLSELLKDRAEIIIQTARDKSVQPPRYLVTIWADGENINDAMKAAK